MKKELGNKERLGHIIDACNYILNSLQGVSEEDFAKNFILHTAVQKWVEIIGEASTKITKVYKSRETGVEWKKIEGMRHVVVHDYFGIDLLRIWDLSQTKIEELKIKVEELYNDYKD